MPSVRITWSAMQGVYTSCAHAWQVILPHIHFDGDETDALQDPDTVQEVQAMRQSHEVCYRVSQSKRHCLLQYCNNRHLPLESI